MSSILKGRLKGFFGVRLDYRPADRDFLKERGEWKIKEITIMRKPVEQYVKTILNVISLGNFENILKKNFDELSHLFLKIKISDETNFLEITLEKNQTIEFNKYDPSKNIGADVFPLKLNGLDTTLNEFLLNGLNSVGKDVFFKYSALNNNCQNFLDILLKANPKPPLANLISVNPGSQEFILQDTTVLKEELSSLSKTLIQKGTDIAAKADIFIHGYGFKFNLQKIGRS